MFQSQLKVIWNQHFQFHNELYAYRTARLVVNHLRNHTTVPPREHETLPDGPPISLRYLCVIVWMQLCERHQIPLHLPVHMIVHLLHELLWSDVGQRADDDLRQMQVFEEQKKRVEGDQGPHGCGPYCTIQCSVWKAFRVAWEAEATVEKDVLSSWKNTLLQLDRELLALFTQEWLAYQSLMHHSPEVAPFFSGDGLDVELRQLRWAELADSESRAGQRRLLGIPMYTMPLWNKVNRSPLAGQPFPLLGLWGPRYHPSVVDEMLSLNEPCWKEVPLLLSSGNNTMVKHPPDSVQQARWERLTQKPFPPHGFDLWATQVQAALKTHVGPILCEWERRETQTFILQRFMEHVRHFHHHPTTLTHAVAFLFQRLTSPSIVDLETFWASPPSSLLNDLLRVRSSPELFAGTGRGVAMITTMEEEKTNPNDSFFPVDRWRVRPKRPFLPVHSPFPNFGVYMEHFRGANPLALQNAEECRKTLDHIRSVITAKLNALALTFLDVFSKYSWLYACDLWSLVAEDVLHHCPKVQLPVSMHAFLTQLEGQGLQLKAQLTERVPDRQALMNALQDQQQKFESIYCEIQCFYLWLSCMEHPREVIDIHRAWMIHLQRLRDGLEISWREHVTPVMNTLFHYFKDIRSYEQAWVDWNSDCRGGGVAPFPSWLKRVIPPPPAPLFQPCDLQFHLPSMEAWIKNHLLSSSSSSPELGVEDSFLARMKEALKSSMTMSCQQSTPPSAVRLQLWKSLFSHISAYQTRPLVYEITLFMTMEYVVTTP